MSRLDQKGKVLAEYVWLGGAYTTGGFDIRQKTKTLDEAPKYVSDLPIWNFDGSSTGQAPGSDSEVLLKPVTIFADPFRGAPNILVLCECILPVTMKPIGNNTRAAAKELFDQAEEEWPWFGIEQEYTLFEKDGKTPLGWPQGGFPGPQGPYYCSAGADVSFGRSVMEAHYEACLYAGITIAGINAEVMPGQWEYQIGPCVGIDSGDHLWMSRYLMIRVCEAQGVNVSFDPKPIPGDWNGAGCHTNYSTEKMRQDGGYEEIITAIKKLGAKHMEHIKVYGTGNERRLTGAHETAPIDKFSYGVANRGASIRIPRQAEADKKGYFEDRRPASNMDPYVVTSKIFKTTCLDSAPPETAGTCDVGVIGLAVMGSNLALNIADRGFQVAVYNRTAETMEKFIAANKDKKNLHGCKTMEDFKNALKKPRRALILVKAGGPTDATIKQLCEVFEEHDIIVDTGNAHFRDQTRRAEELEAKGLRFLGMGISGGEEGARKGPAFFPGGTLSVWQDIKDVIEAASAKAEDGRPCATMNGKGGAGSCVKMYHNAGEYAILQLWGEIHAVLKSWGVPPAKEAEILTAWKTKTGGSHPNLLASYMLDITVEAVRMQDSAGAGGVADGKLLIEKTKDMVGSKGTGLWSVQEALGAGVPAPSLAEAVLARQMSMVRDERLANTTAVPLPATAAPSYTDEDIEDLFWATAFAIIASYAQMFQCLRALDKEFSFGLNLPATIATFRAGCILQGYLLKPMTIAFEKNPDLPNLISAFAPELKANMPRYKRVVAKILGSSNAVAPVLLASMTYIQTMYADSLPSAQCTALQRDVFGRHGFKRLDKEGDFNAQWPELQ